MLDVKAIDLYYGAAQALRGISMKAVPGTVTCILGRNGVGKTSLLRALIGEHPVSRGSVNWEDQDITGLRPHERARRGIAYVPQGRDIFPLLTVEENLKTGFAPLRRKAHSVPDTVFSLFPVLRTKGIQPSIIKDIGRAIAYLRGLGNIAIVLVEQYLDFAQELGDHFAVMDRGQVVYSSTRADMDEVALKRALAL
jgi:urea transport system ATP-binding protein